ALVRGNPAHVPGIPPASAARCFPEFLQRRYGSHQNRRARRLAAPEPVPRGYASSRPRWRRLSGTEESQGRRIGFSWRVFLGGGASTSSNSGRLHRDDPDHRIIWLSDLTTPPVVPATRPSCQNEANAQKFSLVRVSFEEPRGHLFFTNDG